MLWIKLFPSLCSGLLLGSRWMSVCARICTLLSVCLSLSLCLSLSVCLSVSLSFSLTLSLSLSLSLCLSVCLSLTYFHTFSHIKWTMSQQCRNNVPTLPPPCLNHVSNLPHLAAALPQPCCNDAATDAATLPQSIATWRQQAWDIIEARWRQGCRKIVLLFRLIV